MDLHYGMLLLGFANLILLGCVAALFVDRAALRRQVDSWRGIAERWEVASEGWRRASESWQRTAESYEQTAKQFQRIAEDAVQKMIAERPRAEPLDKITYEPWGTE